MYQSCPSVRARVSWRHIAMMFCDFFPLAELGWAWPVRNASGPWAANLTPLIRGTATYIQCSIYLPICFTSSDMFRILWRWDKFEENCFGSYSEHFEDLVSMEQSSIYGVPLWLTIFDLKSKNTCYTYVMYSKHYYLLHISCFLLPTHLFCFILPYSEKCLKHFLNTHGLFWNFHMWR